MSAAAGLVDELGHLFALLTASTRGIADEALSATQRSALAEIGLAGELRLNELAQRIGVSDAAASRAVDALVAAGLVERTPHPDDGRAVRIAVTAIGATRLHEWRSRAEAVLAEALEPLSAAEAEELGRLVHRLTESLVQTTGSPEHGSLLAGQ